MISLRHWLIFRTVSETGNFTRAAEKLYLTQSAVSHAIRELEESVGAVLFDRLSKRVQLTAGGRLLLEEVTPLLAASEALERRLGHLERRAPLPVVSSITIASFWLPRILLEMRRQLPETPVHVEVAPAAEAVRVLQAGGAELALVEGVRPQGPFLCRRFAEYPLKVVCAPHYPAAGRRLSAEELCAEDLLLREAGSAIRDTLDSRLYLLGYTAHPVWVSVNSTALVEAAKAGLGITVLPDVLVEEALREGALVSLEVEELALKNDLLAVWHRDKYMSPALKTLLSCLPEEEA